MIKNMVVGLLIAGVLIGSCGMGSAAGEDKPLYARLIEKYPAPKLRDVNSREYKFLIDPAKIGEAPEEALKTLWGQIKAAAAKRGFTVTEREKNPLQVNLSTKEYLDTADQALWQKGYLIRLSTKFKEGKPDKSVGVTVKAICPDDVERVVATPLAVKGVETQAECQENVGMGVDGRLNGYVEKGVSFTLRRDELAAMTLGDFGRYMPELLGLGLPPGTRLISNKAYSYRMRPGFVVLPGTEPCGISMEGWALQEGGKTFLYDFSYGYEDLDYYESGKIHAAGEAFINQVLHDELGKLALPDSGKWGGSKVRVFMKRPIVE